MKILTSLSVEKTRKQIMVFFFLSAILPLLILLYVIFNYVLPVLSPMQVETLSLVFTLCVLAMMGLPLLGFFLVHSWVLSLETLAKDIRSQIFAKGDTPEEVQSDNEVLALRRAFLHLRGELEDSFGKMFQYSDKLIKTNEKLYELSFSDELTGLYNRRYFDFRLNEEISRADRYGHELSIIMLDINDFKSFNDTWGHHLGDEILRRLGDVIREVVRKSDIPFRYGGDEFAVLLPESTVEMADIAANRLACAVDRLQFQEGRGTPVNSVSVSCGVASYAPRSGDDFVRTADLALLKAKNERKGKIAPIAGTGGKAHVTPV